MPTERVNAHGSQISSRRRPAQSTSTIAGAPLPVGSVQLKQALAQPISTSPAAILTLQHNAGNRATQRLFSRHAIQSKLSVGPANDNYEQEADRVANQVMQTVGPAPSVARGASVSPLQRTPFCIQRLIDSATLEQQAGPEGNLQWPTIGNKRKKERAYARLLQTLDDYHLFLSETKVPENKKVNKSKKTNKNTKKDLIILVDDENNMSESEQEGPLDTLQNQLDQVERYAHEFLRHTKNDPRISHIKRLLLDIQRERLTLSDLIIYADDYHGQSYAKAIKHIAAKQYYDVIEMVEHDPDKLEHSASNESGELFQRANIKEILKGGWSEAHSKKISKKQKDTIRAQSLKVTAKLLELADDSERVLSSEDFVGLLNDEETIRLTIDDPKVVSDSSTRVERLFNRFCVIYPELTKLPTEVDDLKNVKVQIQKLYKDVPQNHKDLVIRRRDTTEAFGKFKDWSQEMFRGGSSKDAPNLKRLTKLLTNAQTRLVFSNEYTIMRKTFQAISAQILVLKARILNKQSKKLPKSTKVFPNLKQTSFQNETITFLTGVGWPEGELTALKFTPEGSKDSSPLLGPTAPEKLSDKQKRFLAGKNDKSEDRAKKAYQRGFIARFNDDPDYFHKLVKQGPLLWTLDTDDRLSIGTEWPHNKHAIIAGGHDVWAAGETRIEQSPLTDDFGLDQASESSENDDHPTIFLDFKSGHYSPKLAWRRAHDAWTQVGYKVKWNKQSEWL